MSSFLGLEKILIQKEENNGKNGSELNEVNIEDDVPFDGRKANRSEVYQKIEKEEQEYKGNSEKVKKLNKTKTES